MKEDTTTRKNSMDQVRETAPKRPMTARSRSRLGPMESQGSANEGKGVVSGVGVIQGGLLKRLRSLVPERLLTMPEALCLAELQANRFRELLEIDEACLVTEALTDLPRVLVTSELDLPVSGSTHWSNGRWIVAINGLEHPLRQRFSLAHELKHVIDHTTRHYLYREEPGQPSQVKAERAADYFAGCLLMPKRHIKRLYGQHPGNVAWLAEAFGVTPRAMNFRLDQLGLNQPRPRCGTPGVMGRRTATTSRTRQPAPRRT